ncbi:hypothetical protein H2203_002721 [Taxawa tesnikishii (nom. ined.)]|nr:hypothetical protein H2203_002721 [Dothideales sp. JES 119]
MAESKSSPPPSKEELSLVMPSPKTQCLSMPPSHRWRKRQSKIRKCLSSFFPFAVSKTRSPKRFLTGFSVALARSHHTVTVIGNKAYIFGGHVSDGELASTDIHVVTLPSSRNADAEYACHPAVPHSDDGELPAPRARHTACAKGQHILVFGGCDASSNPIDEDQCLWLWDTETCKWQRVANTNASLGDSRAPGKRYEHSVSLYHDTHLILHGAELPPTRIL